VLTAELGISADEYEALVAAGVTGTLDDTPAHSQRIKEPI
jgi:hypothetical protein